MSTEDADESSKTEEPTSKRLQDARKRGQLATSKEVPTWLMLFGTGLMIVFLAPTIMANLRDLLGLFIAEAHAMVFTRANVGAILTDMLIDVLMVMGWPLILFTLLAVAGYVGQNGFVWTAHPMEPKLSKISPLSGLKKYITAQQYVEFFKGLLKIALIGVVGTILLLPELERLEVLPTLPLAALLDEISILTIRLLVGTLAVLFVIMVFDIFFQRFAHKKKLRMTKQEVKEEFKNQEGDPQIKSRLRKIRMERAYRRMMQAVPEADVVVTNPTHYAVALVYKPEAMAAPKVVAKGQDLVAKRIREIAEEHAVTVVENPPLARALHASVELEEEIPPEHYQAVAEIISYVWNLEGRAMPAGA